MMSNNRRRWVLMLLAAALIGLVGLLAAGCGRGQQPAAPAEQEAAEPMPEQAAQPTAEEAMPSGQEVPEGMVDTSQYKTEAPYTVCFSNASVSNSWRVSMVEHVRYEIEQHPEIATYHETDANDDPAKQISDTEDLLTRGCDVLILSPATQDALTPIAEEAMAQGVPVVTLDRNVANEDAYVSYVTSDNCEMGRQQAEWLVDALDNQGQVLLLAGLAGASPAEDRLRCAREVIENSDLEILDEAYSDWSPVEGKRVMENWITTYGDEIDGVWSGSGLQASGAIEAFVEAGMDVPPITGEDFNRYFKLWDDLGFEGVAVSFPVRQGRVAVQTALKVLAGEPVEKTVDVPRTIVTQENLDQYVRHDLPDDYWADSDPEVAARLFPEAQIESPGTPAATEAVAEDMVDTSQYKTEAPYTVCFSNASVSNSWRVSMVEHVRYEIEQHPEIATYHETDANDDPAKQISDTEDLLTRGCDVLILSPATQDALTPIAEEAMAQGVPVVTLDRNVANEDAYVSYVTSDNCEMGRQQAEWLVDALDNQGQVLLLAGLAGASPAEDRLRCAREVIENSDLEILDEAYSDWSPVEGKRIMENWITTYGDEIDGVWSGSGLQASGAIEAFVEAGMDVPPITGEDFNRYFKLWDDLGFEGVAVSFPVRQGRVAVQTALKVLAGEPVEKTVDVPRTIVTQENLDQYVRHDLPDDYWADSDPEVVERLFPDQ